MKRMTYLCRIGRTSLGLPRQAKADMSIKTAQLPALCLLNQYGIKKLSTVSDNKSKKCLVKSGKDILADRKKFQGEWKIFQGEKKKYPADNLAQKGKEERKQKEIPFVHSVFVLVENK